MEKDENERTYTISIENSIPKTSVEGSKTWNDAENQDGKRPAQIVINLLKNGKKIDSQTVTEKDGWKWKFENLAVKENGELINYSISEEAVPGYTAEVKGYDVENSYVPEKTSVKVIKVWQDQNNQDGKRPQSISVRLLADGQAVSGKTLVLTKENNWAGEFSDLDKYKAGQEIAYTIEEIDVDSRYTSNITGTATDGYVITNSRKPEPPTTQTTKPSEPSKTTQPSETTYTTTNKTSTTKSFKNPPKTGEMGIYSIAASITLLMAGGILILKKM